MIAARIRSIDLPVAPGWARIAAITLAVALSLLVVLKAPLLIWRSAGAAEMWRALADLTYYNVAFLSASYPDAGFVRRGLAGTIAQLLARDTTVAVLLFHLLSALLLIAGFAVLQWRLLRSISWPAAAFLIFFAIFSPQTFGGWTDDIGRTDLLVLAITTWAVVAIDRGRPLVSSALLVIGFLVHETAIVFGLPLLVAAAALSLRDGNTRINDVRRAAILLVAALVVIVVVQSFTTPTATVFAVSMQRNTPAPVDAWHRDLRDCAVYMMITGLRGLRTAICYNVYWPAFGLMVAFSIAVAIVNGAILGLERRFWWFALAVLVPLVFMNAVANDTGRWVKFACANAWVLAALYQGRGEHVPGGPRLAVNAVLLAGMMYMGTSPVHEVNRASFSVARRLGMPPPPPVDEWMTRCDRDWRAIAQGRAAP